jgi:hypothetical protein
MITPSDLKLKADKSFFRIASAELKGVLSFPMIIPSNKGVSGSNYSDWKNDIVPLYQESKGNKGKGYSVDWKDKVINGSRQKVPAKIYIETLEDFLHLTRRFSDYQKITDAHQLIMSHFPELAVWAGDNPLLLLQYATEWQELIAVCKFFTSNSSPHLYYIREIPVEVHSKFIETHTGILKKLLDILLPETKVNKNESDFEGRYFLKKSPISAQIRVLDDTLRPFLGYKECSLPLDDAAWLKWTPSKVFIIENKTCFLTFPKVKGAVSIFGEGFKSRISKHIPWLKKTKLYCWFDLDGAGFEMLNMVREHYPNAISFLMDDVTLRTFEKFVVYNNPKIKTLSYLLPAEQRLYHYLVKEGKRLEQEKISQQYVLQQIDFLPSPI